MDTIDRILDLMKKHNVTAAKLTRDIPLTNGLITQWKQGKQKPSTEAIVKIAQYFNVSTDYLLCLADNPTPQQNPSISAEDIETLKDLKELSAEDRKLVETIIRMRKQQEAGALKND